MSGRSIRDRLYQVIRHVSGQVDRIAPDSNLIVIWVKNFVLCFYISSLVSQWPHNGIFLLQWIMYWTFLFIHSRRFWFQEGLIIWDSLFLNETSSTYIFALSKTGSLDNAVQKFSWLSHYRLWVIILCARTETSYTGSILVHCNNPLFLQNKVGKINV